MPETVWNALFPHPLQGRIGEYRRLRWLRHHRDSCALVDYDALSAERQVHFDVIALYILQSILGSYYLHREGAISHDAWQDGQFWLSTLTSQPGFYSMWESGGHEFRRASATSSMRA
jgi:hypothetical protein